CAHRGRIEPRSEQIRVSRIGCRNEATDLLFQRSDPHLGKGLEVFAEFRCEGAARQRLAVLLHAPLTVLVLEIEATIVNLLGPRCGRDWKGAPTHVCNLGPGAGGKLFERFPQSEPGIRNGMEPSIE